MLYYLSVSCLTLLPLCCICHNNNDYCLLRHCTPPAVIGKYRAVRSFQCPNHCYNLGAIVLGMLGRSNRAKNRPIHCSPLPGKDRQRERERERVNKQLPKLSSCNSIFRPLPPNPKPNCRPSSLARKLCFKFVNTNSSHAHTHTRSMKL